MLFRIDTPGMKRQHLTEVAISSGMASQPRASAIEASGT
jgi:hypothetical protein